MALNYTWAEGRVKALIALFEEQRTLSNDTAGRRRHREIDDEINQSLNTVLHIARAFNPAFATGLATQEPGGWFRHVTQLQTCQILLGAILDAEEIRANIDDTSPKLATADMHPWVWDHAKTLLTGAHGRAAVQTAGTALFDSHVPTKLAVPRDGKGGFTLMGAFSTNDPVPSLPRLRLPGYDRAADEQSWKNAHEGAMHLGQGCALAIRNLSTHDLREPDPQEALEMLAALSLVARLVDRAEVVRVTQA